MYLQRYGFRGTTYNPSTIRGITGRQLISGALSRGAWITALVTSVIGNVIDYGFGGNRDRGILSQEFAVSTAVDTFMAVGTGLAAAALVALLPVTLPVWGAIALTAIAGLGIGFGLERLGIAQRADDYLNARIDALEPAAIGFGERVTSGLQAWWGIAANARVIGRVLADRARDGVEHATQAAAEATQDAARAVRDRATAAAQAARGVLTDAVDAIRGLFGGLLGGG
jgi:hypothetical protein